MQRLELHEKALLHVPARKTFGLSILLALVASFIPAGGRALAQAAYCSSLQAEIARAGHSGPNPGGAKQQAELNRLAAYAHSLGCDREQFLFFGDPPPAQCPGLNAKIAQLRAAVGAVRGGDETRRQALIAQFNAECRGGRAQQAAVQRRPRNFLEELFGVPSEESPGGFSAPGEEQRPPEDGVEAGVDDGHPRGGSMAVCVRSCDGGFFPLNFSARRANLDDLNELCKALCPNAETTLYTKAPGNDISTAVSMEGESYADHPNALKFQTSYDSSCGCKPPGTSWAEALEQAERLLAASRDHKDAVVSVEQAEQLSRPDAPRKSRQSKTSPTRQDAPVAPKDQAPIAPEAVKATPSPEVYKEIIGPDGVKKRVRVVAPSL